MSNNTSEPLVTYEAYCALPEDVRCELIDGVLYMTPAPTVPHQIVKLRLARTLSLFAEEQGLGLVLDAPTDVVLREADPAVVVQPDVLFVRRERRGIVRRRGIFGAPDLAIEVVSPSNPRHDIETKRKLYAIYGVEEYWLVLPDLEQVQVMRFGTDGPFARPALYVKGDALTTPLLPGLAIALDDLFRALDFPDDA